MQLRLLNPDPTRFRDQRAYSECGEKIPLPRWKEMQIRQEDYGWKSTSQSSWEYRQILAEGMVLPHHDLFNVLLGNSIISDVGPTILQFDKKTQPSSFWATARLRLLTHMVEGWKEACIHSMAGSQVHHYLTGRGLSNSKPKCPCCWHGIAASWDDYQRLRNWAVKLELYKLSSIQRSTKFTSCVTLEDLDCEQY